MLKKFIFASSGSVYGVSKDKKVTENTKLVPISNYNKTKNDWGKNYRKL